MKKTKLLTAFAATVALCGMAFTLYGCNGQTEEPEPTKYTVTYAKGADGVTGTAPTETSHAKGETFTVATNTFTYEGYTFENWSDGTATYAAGATYTMPEGNVTFTAQWKANEQPAKKEFTVTFKNGETTVDTQTVSEGGGITLPDAPAAAEGKKFNGWYVGETKIDATYKPTADTTVTAKWDNLAQYTVTFKNGDTTVDTQTVYEGGKVTLPDEPTKNGFTFKGWVTGDKTAFDANAAITANMELQASWEIAFAGYWTGNQSVGTVQIISADGENGIVGYAYYMLMVFSIREGTDGFTLDPVGISDAVTEGASLSLTYAKTADKATVSLISIAPDSEEPGETETQTFVFDTVRALATTKFYNGNYSVVDMGGGDEGGGESQPEARDAAQPEAAAKKITYSNGAFTAVGFEELTDITLANPLVFEGAYVFTGTKGGSEYCAYFADYGLIDSIMSVYSGSAVGKELLVFMYLDESLTSLEEPPMYLLTKDLAPWGSKTEEIVFYDLYKGQSLTYGALVSSNPANRWNGLVAKLFAEDLTGSYFFRSDAFAYVPTEDTPVDKWDWGDTKKMTATWNPAFNEDKFKAQSKGGKQMIQVTLKADGTLEVVYGFMGAAEGENNYSYTATYTSVDKYDSLTVGFARDGVEVSAAGVVQVPIEEFDVRLELNSGTFPGSDSIDLYYTIPYDKSGTTTFTLPETAPVFEGHTFKGWLYSADNELYQPGATVTLTQEYCSFYAEFEEITYTVTIETGSQDVEVPDGWNNEKYPSGYEVYLPSLDRTGYTLTGWTVKCGNEDIPVNGEKGNWSFTMPEGNVTATANWEKTVYTITYENGGYGDVTGMPDPATVTAHYGDVITLPAAPALTGYTFAGWQHGNGNELYEAEAEYTVRDEFESVTFMAQWTEVGKFSVTYAAGIASGAEMPSHGSYAAGETVTLPTADPTHEDYNFTGWKVFDNAETEIIVTSNSFVMPESNVTIYAQWTEKEFTVEYKGGDLDDSSYDNIPTDNQKYKKNAEVTLSDQVPTRTDYVFDGWVVTDKEGNRVQVDGNKFLMPAGGATVTAQWVELYTVTFKVNEDDETALKIYTVEAEAKLGTAQDFAMPETSKDYFRFDGWYVGGVQVTADYVPTENVTAVAKFTQTEALPSANQTPTTENPIVIGKEDHSNGWSAEHADWLQWVTKINAGEKKVFSGTMTSNGAGNYQTIDALLFSGLLPAGFFRPDAWILDNGNVGAGADMAAAEKWTITKIEAEYAPGAWDGSKSESLTNIYKSCNVTVTYDWSDETKIIITISMVGNTADNNTLKSAMTYMITAAASETLKDHYSIAFFAESSCTKFTKIETVNWKEHQHEFEQGVCTKDGCGAEQYTTTLNGKEYSATTSKSRNLLILDTTGAWQNDGTPTSTMDIPASGDFVAIISWAVARDNNYGGNDAWIELQNAGGYFDVNPTEGIWGDLSTATGVQVTDSGKEGMPVLGDGSNGAWEGSYRVVITRIGNTLKIEYAFTHATNGTWTRTVTAIGFTTEDIAIRLAGNPYWIDKPVYIYGALSENN